MVVLIREKNLLSRLLYPNPVCLLTIKLEVEAESGVKSYERNIMTISWLTPIDNYGNFICSINKKRHSADLIMKARCFVLNIPVHGQESMIVSIGSVSGRLGDKFEFLGIPATVPGSGVGVNVNCADAFEQPPWKRTIPLQSNSLTSNESMSLPGADSGGPMPAVPGSSSQRRREAEEQQENARMVAVEGVAAHIICSVDGTFEDMDSCASDGGDPTGAAARDSGTHPYHLPFSINRKIIMVFDPPCIRYDGPFGGNFSRTFAEPVDNAHLPASST